MPPLHIQLNLIQKLVEALIQNVETFKYLKRFFPKFSEATVKADIFVGSQIKQIVISDRRYSFLNLFIITLHLYAITIQYF